MIVTQQHSTVQVDFYAAFQEKLKLCGIINPDAKAITRLVLTFPAQMQAAACSSVDPGIALHLYQQIKDLPGTETRANMVQEDHISINGPHLPSHPHILTAVDLDSCSLLVLKLLLPTSQEQQEVAQREKRAVSLLQLDTAPVDRALVPTQIHSVKVSADHAKSLGAGSYDALKMPWYPTSLQELPQLSHNLLYSGGRRLQQAVTAMHKVSLLHTDLKASNVFVDLSGAWFLGDFGASHLFGDKITSCTEAMYPGNMAFQPAAPKYDWGLLVVLLAVEMDKKNWTQLCNNTEPRKMNLQRVLQKCKSDHQDLQALFDELVAAAGWENA